MGICLNNLPVTKSKNHELAKSAWQIHVKTKMRSSWLDEKYTFGSLASLLPFLPDAEAAALLLHSEGVCVNAQWPHSSRLPSVWSYSSSRIFRWLHPKRPASCSWYWDRKSASCSDLSLIHNKSLSTPLFPPSALCPLHPFSVSTGNS